MIYVKRWSKFNTIKSIHDLRRIQQIGQASSTRKKNPLITLTQRISQLSVDGKIAIARKIFDQMAVRDSVSWNVMIRSYVENKMVEDARELFEKMPERTSFSYNTMMTGHIKSGKTHIALKLFVVMPEKDVVSWTVMVTGLCRASMVNEARHLFHQMPNPNAVSWLSIISGFQQHGFPNESLHAFKEMLSSITRPIPHSFTSALSACADLTLISLSEQMYSQVLKRGFQSNTHISNSAISMFAKIGNFHCARRVFINLDKPDLVTWNSMIAGFALHGYGLEVIMTFHQMQKACVLPDGISFLGVLHGCSHRGLVREGTHYFHSMKIDYGISPGLGHFSTIVDLYSRAGKLREAYEIIMNMPFEPNAILWRTLLNGCRMNGDLELGVCVAEKILKLEPYSSSACSMVVHILALAGKWNEVAKMRRHMRDNMAGRKELGCSWIDVKGKSNIFTTGDEIHSEADNVFTIVELLGSEIARYHFRSKGLADELD